MPLQKTVLFVGIFLLGLGPTLAQSVALPKDIDAETFLLGMLIFPRYTSSNPSYTQDLGTFCFKHQSLLALFVDTAKAMGITDLKVHQIKKEFFASSKTLSERLKTYLVFVDRLNFKDNLYTYKDLKLNTYYSFFQEKYKELPPNFVESLQQVGYPNPYLLDQKKQQSFILGFLAHNAYLNHAPDLNQIRGRYTCTLSSYNLAYINYVENIMQHNGFKIVARNGRSSVHEGQEYYSYQYKFNAPKEYDPFVAAIIASKK